MQAIVMRLFTSAILPSFETYAHKYTGKGWAQVHYSHLYGTPGALLGGGGQNGSRAQWRSDYSAKNRIQTGNFPNTGREV